MTSKIKIFLTATVFTVVTFAASAQQTKTITKTTTKSKTTSPKPALKAVPVTNSIKPDQPIPVTDRKPSFPGGDEAIEQYFIKALAEIPLKQASKVTLTLEIDETGKVKEAQLKNGYRQYENRMLVENPEVNKAIIEAALKMPNWTPGLTTGKPAAFQHHIEFIAMSPEKAKEISEQVYIAVEMIPAFPGGEEALKEYLKTNMKYPKDARDQKLEGMVVTQFTVTRFGEIKDIAIIKPLSESLTAEARRLIAEMPRWTPGKQNGNHVNIRYTLPVVFKL